MTTLTYSVLALLNHSTAHSILLQKHILRQKHVMLANILFNVWVQQLLHCTRADVPADSLNTAVALPEMCPLLAPFFPSIATFQHFSLLLDVCETKSLQHQPLSLLHD